MTTAKIFWNGRSQAVRLPKKYRFDATEVIIQKEGDAVILTLPKKRAWPSGYWRSFGGLSADFELPSDAPPAPNLIWMRRGFLIASNLGRAYIGNS